jgi:hypothetical protein
VLGPGSAPGPARLSSYPGRRANTGPKYVSPAMVTVNVVVLAGTVAADPVERRMPSGDEVTELRLTVPEAGKRLLPVAAWLGGPDRLARPCALRTLARGPERRN